MQNMEPEVALPDPNLSHMNPTDNFFIFYLLDTF